MGFFKSVNSFFEQYSVTFEASKIIVFHLQNRSVASFLEDDPRNIAGNLLDMAWKDNRNLLHSVPDLLPSPIILAAFSMANGIKTYKSEFQRIAVVAALGNLIIEFFNSFNKNDLNHFDEKILETTIQILSDFFREVQDTKEFSHIKEKIENALFVNEIWQFRI